MSFALLKSACLHVSPYFHFPGSLFGITPKGLTNTSGITSIQNGPNSEGSLSYYKWSSPKAVPPDHLRQNNWSPLDHPRHRKQSPLTVSVPLVVHYRESTMKRGSIDWSLSDTNRRPVMHDTRSQNPTNTTNMYRIPSFHSASNTRVLLQWELCHLPLLQRLQQMLPHLVLIEQAVFQAFSMCKRCGKGQYKKAAVGSRGDRRLQGWWWWWGGGGG